MLDWPVLPDLSAFRPASRAAAPGFVLQGFRELIRLHLARVAERTAARRQDELRDEIASILDKAHLAAITNRG